MAHSFLSPWISLAITQPAHPLGAVGAPDAGTEGGSAAGEYTHSLQECYHATDLNRRSTVSILQCLYHLQGSSMVCCFHA